MEPLRTCIGCGQVMPQDKLIRISRDKNGRISVDRDRLLPGRGAYICGDADCVEKVIKKRKLNRAFRTEVEPEIYELIREEIKNRGNIEK